VISTAWITIHVDHNPPQSIQVAFYKHGFGKTRASFDNGDEQVINWDLEVSFTLDALLVSRSETVDRYILLRKNGFVRLMGTVDHYLMNGSVPRLEFDRNRSLDLRSDNGWLDLSAATGEALGIFFTVETHAGRAFYPRHVRYTRAPEHEETGVEFRFDFPQERIFPYEHELVFRRSL